VAERLKVIWYQVSVDPVKEDAHDHSFAAGSRHLQAPVSHPGH
jgi:hypothetical protein